MNQIAAHLHGDVENIELLQTIYLDLINQNMESAYFLQALQLVTGMG